MRETITVRRTVLGDPEVWVGDRRDSAWLVTSETPNAWRNALARAHELRRQQEENR